MKQSLGRSTTTRHCTRKNILFYYSKCTWSSVDGLFLESITTNGEEIKDNMYPVNIFMLLHETNKVYLSFTNEFTLSLLIPFYKRLIKTISCVHRRVLSPKIFTRWTVILKQASTSQHTPAHASTRQNAHFALFSGFFNIRLLLRVFSTFCIKISAKSITDNEILRFF